MNIKIIENIKKRYFCHRKKEFLHFGDCSIYSAGRPFCSCGLLHELGWLDFNFSMMLYPKFEADDYLQTMGKKKPKKETVNQKKAKELLEQIFGKIGLRQSFEDIKFEYDEYKKILKSILSKKECPGAYKRLNLWLTKELTKPLD